MYNTSYFNEYQYKIIIQTKLFAKHEDFFLEKEL